MEGNVSIFPMKKIDTRHLSSIDGFWHIIIHVRVIQIYGRPLTCMGFLILFVPFEVFSQTHEFALPLLNFVRTHSGYVWLFWCCFLSAYSCDMILAALILTSQHAYDVQYSLALCCIG